MSSVHGWPRPSRSKLAQGVSAVLLAPVVAVCVLPSVGQAATITWANNGGTNFNAGASWTGGVAPGAADFATFATAAVNQPNLTAPLTITTVDFSTASSSGYVLTGTGGSLTVTGATALRSANSTGTTNIVAANIILGGGPGSSPSIGASTGTFAISGNISEAGAGTAVDLSRISANFIYTFSGNNTFSGGMRVTNSTGLVNLNSPTAPGKGTISITSGSGQSFDNASGVGIALTNNNSFIASSSTSNFTISGSNDLNFGTGRVTMMNADKTFTVGNSGIATIAGIDQDATPRGMTKSGTGTLAITGASNHTGNNVLSAGGIILGDKLSLGTGTTGINAITVSASADLSGANAIGNAVTLGGNSTFTGTNNIQLSGAITATGTRTVTNNIAGGLLTLSNANINLSSTGSNFTLTLNGTGDTLISGSINQGASTGSLLTYSGIGSLTLRGTNTYAGATTVNHGTLTLDAANGGSLATGNPLNIGGKFVYTGATGGSAQTLGTLVLSAGTGSTPAGMGQIVVGGGAATNLTVGNTWTRSTASSLNIDLSAGTTLTSSPTITNSLVTGSSTAAAFTVTDATTTGFATTDGSGHIVRYTGGTALAANSGGSTVNFVMDVNPTSAAGGGAYPGGALTLAAGSTNSLRLANTSAAPAMLTLGGTTSLGGRGVLFTGTQDFTVTGGQLGANALEVILHQYSTTNKLIIASRISDSTANGTFTKTGPGEVVMAATNTFQGPVGISAGTLTATNAAAFGGTTGNTTVANGAVLQLDGTSGNLSFGAEGLQLIGLGKAGSANGALRNVAGSNSWGGAITVLGAAPTAIQADTGSTLGLSGTITNNGNQVAFNTVGSGVINVANTFSGAGALLKSGTGTLGISVPATHTGNTSITGGKLALTGTGSLATSPRIIVGTTSSETGAQLDVSGVSGMTLGSAQSLSGYGGVVGAVTGVAGSKVAPGNGTRTYGSLGIASGDFTLGAGTLSIELAKATPGVQPASTGYDRVVSTGSANVNVTGGNLAITSDMSVQIGDIYYIVSNSGGDSVIGNFASLNGVAGSLAEGAVFNIGSPIVKITYLANDGVSFAGGNDIAIQVLAVPEPTTLALAGLGVAGMMLRRRRVSA